MRRVAAAADTLERPWRTPFLAPGSLPGACADPRVTQARRSTATGRASCLATPVRVRAASTDEATSATSATAGPAPAGARRSTARRSPTAWDRTRTRRTSVVIRRPTPSPGRSCCPATRSRATPSPAARAGCARRPVRTGDGCCGRTRRGGGRRSVGKSDNDGLLLVVVAPRHASQSTARGPTGSSGSGSAMLHRAPSTPRSTTRAPTPREDGAEHPPRPLAVLRGDIGVVGEMVNRAGGDAVEDRRRPARIVVLDDVRRLDERHLA